MTRLCRAALLLPLMAVLFAVMSPWLLLQLTWEMAGGARPQAPDQSDEPLLLLGPGGDFTRTNLWKD